MNSQEQRPTPYQPSRWWLAVWIAITTAAVGSWVYIAMRSHYDNGNPIQFGDNALINFLTLTPVLGTLAVCTWVIRSAQSRIAGHAEQQAKQRHTELLGTLDNLRGEKWRQMLEEITAGGETKPEVVDLRSRSNR